MRELLKINIVNEIEKIDDELQEIKYAINDLDRVDDKLNTIRDRKERIFKLVDKLRYLEEQLKVRFPGEINVLIETEKELNKRLIQLEDLLVKI
jgi:hypothetical protein